MKFVALISGGKDSVLALHMTQSLGHQVIALAHLKPRGLQDETDSYMYQSVGSNVIQQLADAAFPDLPLYTATIQGTPNATDSNLYCADDPNDEVEDLYKLLSQIKHLHADLQGVCTGAIWSTYQKNRVENVCARLSLRSIAPLWHYEQQLLLNEMVDFWNLDVRLIKCASLGLDHHHINKSLLDLRPHLQEMHKKYQINPCGEGGEYETLTLNAPAFAHRLILDVVDEYSDGERMYPVWYARVSECHAEKNEGDGQTFAERVAGSKICEKFASGFRSPDFTYYSKNWDIEGLIAAFKERCGWPRKCNMGVWKESKDRGGLSSGGGAGEIKIGGVFRSLEGLEVDVINKRISLNLKAALCEISSVRLKDGRVLIADLAGHLPHLEGGVTALELCEEDLPDLVAKAVVLEVKLAIESLCYELEALADYKLASESLRIDINGRLLDEMGLTEVEEVVDWIVEEVRKEVLGRKGRVMDRACVKEGDGEGRQVCVEAEVRYDFDCGLLLRIFSGNMWSVESHQKLLEAREKEEVEALEQRRRDAERELESFYDAMEVQAEAFKRKAEERQRELLEMIEAASQKGHSNDWKTIKALVTQAMSHDNTLNLDEDPSHSTERTMLNMLDRKINHDAKKSLLPELDIKNL